MSEDYSFNIKDFLPEGHKDTKGARSANLMAYLLQDITYNELYKEPFYYPGKRVVGGALKECALERLNRHAGTLRHTPYDLPATGSGGGFSVAEQLRSFTKKAALETMRDELSKEGMPEIILGELFWKSRNQEYAGPKFTQEEAGLVTVIVEAFEKIYADHGDKVEHLCIPFLAFQSGKIKKLLTEKDVSEFLAELGDLKLYQFFNRTGDKDQRAAAKKAREKYILREYRSDTVSILNNGRCCGSDGRCDTTTVESWCNEVVEGQPGCSLASDSC